MNRGGITKRIVNAANAMVGHVRGGLGYVSILAILLFAAWLGLPWHPRLRLELSSSL